MRHRKAFNHLGRTSAHRKAMLANMANSLIMHKRITTTTAKAKALRMFIEPLITKSKEDTTHSRRIVFSSLKDKYAVAELFREISPKVVDRPGGYTRILKMGNRHGDNADMCMIELVDYNENMLESVGEAKAKTTRRGRRGRKKAVKEAPEPATEKTTVVSEEVSEAPEQAGTEGAKAAETPGENETAVPGEEPENETPEPEAEQTATAEKISGPQEEVKKDTDAPADEKKEDKAPEKDT